MTTLKSPSAIAAHTPPANKMSKFEKRQMQDAITRFNASNPVSAYACISKLESTNGELLAALEATTQWCADLEANGYACPELLTQARAAIAKVRQS